MVFPPLVCQNELIKLDLLRILTIIIMKSVNQGWIKIILLGIIISALAASVIVKIVRLRIINIYPIESKLIEGRILNETTPIFNEKVVIQKDKGLDQRCISGAVERLNSGWMDNPYPDQDFFVNYYVPPGKKALICLTPALAAALSVSHKRLSYMVFRSEHGLRVKIILGVSAVDDLCKSLTGNINCANSLLLQQAVVSYKP